MLGYDGSEENPEPVFKPASLVGIYVDEILRRIDHIRTEKELMVGPFSKDTYYRDLDWERLDESTYGLRTWSMLLN